MKLSALLFLLPFAAAECPNACSGHGECGQYDSCDCYSGFQGGDCSERVCPFNWAWVTTANGDLNFDGDRFDGTVYSTEVRVAQTNEKLLTQAAPGGTWETWPYYQTQEEGHFYMECSNRGLCDRQTGECQCFDGFDGHACNRMACPENCNGRGRCKSVTQLTNSAYKKWDRDMARECVCDPGFSGPTCAERLCPYGNDVLTQTNELTETQTIDIFTTCEGSGGACTGDLANAASSAHLGGTFSLTYTDHYGESYTTDQIAIDDYDGSTQTVATAAAVALKALPNNVISDQIEVTASSCYTVDVDTVDFSTVEVGADITAATNLAAGDYYTASTTEGQIWDADGSVMVEDATTVANRGQTGTAGTVTATTTIFRYTNPICLRLKVEFIGMSGNLNQLAVDHSLVSYNGFTNAQHTNAGVSSTVTDSTQITSGLVAWSYTRPSTVSVTSTDAQIDAAGNGKDVTCAATEFTNVAAAAPTTTFYPDSRIEIECDERVSGAGTADYRSLGYYTIASMTGTTITTVETIVPSSCTAASSQVRITQISNILVSDGDADLTAGFAELGTPATNARVGITISGTTTNFNSKVNAAKIKQTKVLDADTGKTAYIILDHEDTSSNAALMSADVSSGTGHIFLDGAGTEENNECGDRGLCDAETGECKCFAGYTGDACHIQKSISA